MSGQYIRGDICMRVYLKVALCVAAAAGFATTASAGTANANLGISASVAATCSLTTSAVSFGAYSGTQIDATGTVTANCVIGTPWNIGLGAGSGSGATTSSRKMTSGANTLTYALYSDAGRSQNWGNTIGTDTLTGTGTGATDSHTVYGRIAAGTVPAAGSYADTVIATITF
jgi:spore coat protein U-like protein